MTACAAAVAIWLPAAILPLDGPAGAARVVFLHEPAASDLPEGVSIYRWSGRTALLSGVDARSARALYAMGAVFVYPVRATGCLELSRT
ncbi:MAG: hypothetical protein KL863_15055 [Rhizobium sp.]|nr:hypothetical protein [Rhizobium sp.]